MSTKMINVLYRMARANLNIDLKQLGTQAPEEDKPSSGQLAKFTSPDYRHPGWNLDR